MLVDVEVRFGDPVLSIIAGMNGGGGTQRLREGVYSCGHFSFELEFRGRQDHRFDFPELPGDFSCYGVCDGVDQLLEVMPAAIVTSERRFVVALHEVRRADQSEEGGWRWHKWGPYVGRQEKTTEYLHDEPKVESVWTYHVYEVTS